MILENYAALLVFAFASSVTPGPNNMMLMASGLNHGVRNSMPHFWGICLGFPIMLMVVSCGIFAALSVYPLFYVLIKYAGIGYLFYLAFKIANSNILKANQKIGQPFTFLQAVGFQWLNPKAWAMATGALASFSMKEQYLLSVSAIVSAYIVSGILCMSFWLLLGQKMKVFLNTEKRVKLFNSVLAVILVITVIPALFKVE